MSKKKKQSKSLHCALEGYREELFCNYIQSLYKGKLKLNTNYHPKKGGGGNTTLESGLKITSYDRILIVFDEDFKSKKPITDDVLEKLENIWGLENDILKNTKYREFQEINERNKNKKPTLVVSNPKSIEGILLQILGKNKADLENLSTDALKNSFDGYSTKEVSENRINPITNKNYTEDFCQKIEEKNIKKVTLKTLNIFAKYFTKEILDEKKKRN